MIIYNKLEIQGTSLNIDIEVDTSKDYWKEVTIDSIRIDTSLTYGTDTPYEILNSSKGTVSIIGSTDEIFIITPIVSNISEDAPCGADIPNKGVIYDDRKLIDKGLSYLKELTDSCYISKDFIDFILKQEALKLAIISCNYELAIKYWKYLGTTKSSNINKCSCYGRT
jgi:hypothetical protein